MSRNTFVCRAQHIHLISIYIYPATSLSIKPARKISTVVIHQDGESTPRGFESRRREISLGSPPIFCRLPGRVPSTFVSDPHTMRVWVRSSAPRGALPGARATATSTQGSSFSFPHPPSPQDTHHITSISILVRHAAKASHLPWGPYLGTIWFDIPLSACGHLMCAVPRFCGHILTASPL